MLVFLVLAKLMGIKTLWIDCSAQTEEMSLSGKIAKTLATRAVSQWADVAEAEGVECWGSVF
jgi:Oligosaccharide biosynthesis protein Alg14 like